MFPKIYMDENNHWICVKCKALMKPENGYLICPDCPDCKVKLDGGEKGWEDEA
jgi:Zn finger protein HypA/HybF involved in hydrogenase expression